MSGSETLFGPFRYLAGQRLLLEREKPVQLGARALAVLHVLVETPGELVSKAELLNRAWPGLRVEETNLKAQVSILRKALGVHRDFIKSEAALGYRFVGQVTISGGACQPRQTSVFRVPSSSTVPLGRDEAIRSIIELFSSSRLVTVLGPGGIGKTTLALAVANATGNSYEDGCCFVDLDRVADGSQVCATIAEALGCSSDATSTVEQISWALQGRRLLLILDCCEHLTESVAHFAERVLSETGDVHILATSREALRVSREAAWRLAPLETPPPSLPATAANVRDYASIKVFSRTVRQAMVDFQVDDANADAISEICRRLDGIPLAIELAASMVEVLGVAEVRRGLNQSLSLFSMGRRTAIPRQRSLAATFDWSYNLLPMSERIVLGRLACFAGPFTLDAAIAVASDAEMGAGRVLEAVVALANKSLLSLSHRGTVPEYRLLESTRAYVSLAPESARELGLASERHARYFLELLEDEDWDSHDPAVDRIRMRGYTKEVCAALDWAFSVDPGLGVRLTLAAERLWLELASLLQGIHYLGLASRHVETAEVDAISRARVQVSVASAQAYIMTAGHDDLALYEQAYLSARAAQDDFLQLRALYALLHNLLRERRPLSQHIEEFAAVASRSNDPAVQHIPLVLSAYHDIEQSDVVSSSHKFETFITSYAHLPRKYTSYFGHGLVVMCEVTFAVTRYLMGYVEEARARFARLVESAEHRANSATLCFALTHGAILCELRCGDFGRAGAYLRKLEEVATIYKPWRIFVKAYRALLLRYESEKRCEAERLLSAALQDRAFWKRQGGLLPALLFELAETRLALGDLDGAEDVLQQVAAFRTNDQDARNIGVHDRILAELLLVRRRPGDLETARALFKRAIEVSSFRGIYLFEFDATVGLAELELSVGQSPEARRLMADLLARHSIDQPRFRRIDRARKVLAQTSALAEA